MFITVERSVSAREINMATMREVDTAMWLHNKLSSDDMWSGTNIWSLLTTDVLRNIQDCFHTLDSQVKIKLLMSFLYIPRRSGQEMSSELNDILEIGSGDSDDWVRILSEILRHYPETGSLNIDLENVSPVFAAIVQDIKQISKYFSGNMTFCGTMSSGVSFFADVTVSVSTPGKQI